MHFRLEVQHRGRIAFPKVITLRLVYAMDEGEQRRKVTMDTGFRINDVVNDSNDGALVTLLKAWCGLTFLPGACTPGINVTPAKGGLMPATGNKLLDSRRFRSVDFTL